MACTNTLKQLMESALRVQQDANLAREIALEDRSSKSATIPRRSVSFEKDHQSTAPRHENAQTGILRPFNDRLHMLHSRSNSYLTELYNTLKIEMSRVDALRNDQPSYAHY